VPQLSAYQLTTQVLRLLYHRSKLVVLGHTTKSGPVGGPPQPSKNGLFLTRTILLATLLLNSVRAKVFYTSVGCLADQDTQDVE
jgi:hypothetical protein